MNIARKSFLETARHYIFVSTTKKITVWFSVLFVLAAGLYLSLVVYNIQSGTHSVLQQMGRELTISSTVTEDIKDKAVQLCNDTDCSRILLVDKELALKFIFPNTGVDDNAFFLDKTVFHSKTHFYSVGFEQLSLKFSVAGVHLLMSVSLIKYYKIMLIVFLIFIATLSVTYFMAQKASAEVSGLMDKEIENLSSAVGVSQEDEAIENNIKTREIYDFYKHIINTNKQVFNLLEREKESRKLAAIGQTTAMLAHDVRRPFALIKMLLSIIPNIKEDKEALSRAINEVDQSIKNVDNMLSDIMDFSREVILEVAPFSTAEIMECCLSQVSSLPSSKKVKFLSSFSNTRYILIDSQRFSRAMVNIISNAVDAINSNTAPGTEGVVSVKTFDLDDGDTHYVRIIISNNGPLISEDDMPKIFDTFFTKGKNNGTGLGLASSKKIISLHNGTVVARNNFELGTVDFIVTIPASASRKGSPELVLC